MAATLSAWRRDGEQDVATAGSSERQRQKHPRGQPVRRRPSVCRTCCYCYWGPAPGALLSLTGRRYRPSPLRTTMTWTRRCRGFSHDSTQDKGERVEGIDTLASTGGAEATTSIGSMGGGQRGFKPQPPPAGWRG